MIRRAGHLAAAAAALSLLTGICVAQAQGGSRDGCILDRCQDQQDPKFPGRPPSGGPRSGLPRRPTTASGNFDFYVLALSWSAGFCATTRSQRDRDQCQPGADLGFVVHGLWPQDEHGYPSDCDGAGRPLTPQALDIARRLYPDLGLARYEWRKHGACTGLSPTDYFSDVRDAREQVTIPEMFERATRPQRVSPAAILRAFQAVNPRLRPGMMSVGCTGGVLQEVRICFSKDLRDFRPCEEVVRSSCRAGEITVPPML